MSVDSSVRKHIVVMTIEYRDLFDCVANKSASTSEAPPGRNARSWSVLLGCLCMNSSRINYLKVTCVRYKRSRHGLGRVRHVKIKLWSTGPKLTQAKINEVIIYLKIKIQNFQSIQKKNRPMEKMWACSEDTDNYCNACCKFACAKCRIINALQPRVTHKNTCCNKYLWWLGNRQKVLRSKLPNTVEKLPGW